MKLSEFITDNIEKIMQEWENFARTLFPQGQIVTIKELRDHVKNMLIDIVTYMDKAASSSEQDNKYKALIQNTIQSSMLHGIDRLKQGYTVNQVFAEFRSLRASVLKLFSESPREIQWSDPYDVVRFNSAIDQVLGESVSAYVLTQEKQIRRFDKMISGSPDLYYILDLSGNIIYMNQALSHLYPNPPHEILGQPVYTHGMPASVVVSEAIQAIVKSGEKREGEVSYIDSKGNEYFYKYVFEPIYDDNGICDSVAGASRDITKEKLAEKLIWYNANYDILTGLTNRLRFNNNFEQAIKDAKRSGKSIALLFIDLDNFKMINDTLGHIEGDNLLKQVAERIKHCVRDTDMVSRIGGDEFTVILNNMQDAQQAKIVAEKMLSALRKSFQLKNKKIHITASIGISISPQDSIVTDDLLKQADQAMYQAKKAGHDCYRFWHENR